MNHLYTLKGLEVNFEEGGNKNRQWGHSCVGDDAGDMWMISKYQ